MLIQAAGPFEVDYKEADWIDWDEEIRGPIETKTNLRIWPDRFVWSCCNQRGRAEGCVPGMRAGQHRMRGTGSSLAKGWMPALAPHRNYW